MILKLSVSLYLLFFSVLSVLSQNSSLIENFSITEENNILQQENFGIANGKLAMGILYNNIIGINGLWAPPYVSSDFTINAYINNSLITNTSYKWYPFYINKTGNINNNINVKSKIILSSENRTGLISLTFNNSSDKLLILPISIKATGTLDCYNNDDNWKFGQTVSETPTIIKSNDSSLYYHFFSADGDTIYWQYGNQVKRGIIGIDSIIIDQGFYFNAFNDNVFFFAAKGNLLYWQNKNQVRRGKVENGELIIDTNFKFDGFSSNDLLFDAKGDTLYWNCGNQIRRGVVSNENIIIDPSFSYNKVTPLNKPFATSEDTIYWQTENQICKGKIYWDSIYQDTTFLVKGLSFRDRPFKALGNTIYWQIGNQVERGTFLNGEFIIDRSVSFDGINNTSNLLAISKNTIYLNGKTIKRLNTSSSIRYIKLEQEKQSIVVAVNENFTWDPYLQSITGNISIPALGESKLYLAFSIDDTSNSLKHCLEVINNPKRFITNSEYAYNERVNQLYQKIPTLESDNVSLKHFYDRSLTPFLLNRWDVDIFKLKPYYSTGSINGGCLGEYLWNFGIGSDIMPLFDPEATKEHIKQFLITGTQKGFGFCPVSGSMLEPNNFYPVNQEKIINLAYNYVKNTGDFSFLDEPIGSKTVLDVLISEAIFGDDLTRPVSLIDYNTCDPLNAGGASHLELNSEKYIYRYIMPDLNGRRYLNYEYVAQLSLLAGKPRIDLLDRAEALKTVLKNELWDASKKWFNFEDTRYNNLKDTRYTLIMFYLFNSDVLDKEEKEGLLSHLNDNEFLSTYGVHSLAKGDPAYDSTDVDNGGPGSCTGFPLNISKSLYLTGYSSKADEILSRILWWGEKMPYWGDSFYADKQDYRRSTPLQCTIDGISGAQSIIFGMFGIKPKFDGTIQIHPSQPSFASFVKLSGINIFNKIFDVKIENDTFEVNYNGNSLKASTGQSIILKNNSLSFENNSNILYHGGISNDTLEIYHTIRDFTENDRIFSASNNCYYWQSDNQLRRGIITNDVLSIDQSFKYDNFSSTDRLFAFYNDFIYWQNNNKIQRASLYNNNLIIDNDFGYDGFNSSDRVFAVSDKFIYWQSNNKIMRGTINTGKLRIDPYFTYNGLLSSDYAFNAIGDTIYWQSGNQIKKGNIKNNMLYNDNKYLYNDTSSNYQFITNKNFFYWQFTNNLPGNSQYGEFQNSNSITNIYLGQNAPNPFIDNTTIEYCLPTNTKNASIIIYNKFGFITEKIPLITFNNRTITDLNLSGLRPGLYFYKLIADGKELGSKSMLKISK